MIPKTEFFYPDPKTPQSVDQGTYLTMIPKWTSLLNDWWIGAHVYESGVLECVGIEEPISVGDNIELVRKNGAAELYHIEGYQHDYSVDATIGRKSFITNIAVSRGQTVYERPIYTNYQINEDDITDIGLTDTEFENTARSGSSTTEEASILNPDEKPSNRKKGQ
jgi:hypothetical protein